MKAPICDICLRSSILCLACREKMDRGDITESDVNVSRSLFEVSDRFRSLRSITITKVIETPNNIILVPEKGDAARIIGKGGTIAKELTKLLGKNVRIIEQTSDRREFIEKMIFPATISAMNVLYTDKGEVLKILIPKDKKLPVSEENLRQVVNQVFDIDIRIMNE